MKSDKKERSEDYASNRTKMLQVLVTFLSVISNFVCNRMLETKIKQDFVEREKT